MPPNLVTIEPENAAEDVVETLERALEMARDGQVSSVAIAIVRRDGVGHHMWSGLPMTLAMVGAVARLQHCLNEHIDAIGSGPTAA